MKLPFSGTSSDLMYPPFSLPCHIGLDGYSSLSFTWSHWTPILQVYISPTKLNSSRSSKRCSPETRRLAPLFFEDMKGGNFSCASPSCLAVCTSIRRRSMVRPAIVTKANLRDARKTKPLKPLPKPPSNPKKSRKNSDYRSSTGSGIIVTKDLTSPASSSRYLLNDSAYSDIFPDSEPDLESNEPCLVPSVIPGSSSSSKYHDQVWTPSLVPVSSPRFLLQHSRPSPSAITQHDHEQVVVLRVSLHCKGCEGKVRKHISKMEGVTSFNIDFVTKKVTVMGNVTPLGVLNSVSKVKNAQFWPSPQHVSSSPF